MPHFSSSIAILLVLSFVLINKAQAQLQVNLSPSKKSYLINEAVTVNVQITNNTGTELILKGTPSRPWLSFNITSAGKAVPKTTAVAYKPVSIPMGQTITRSVILSTSYALGNYGNYAVEAAVNMPGPTGHAISSNRDYFVVVGGRTMWSKKVGIPNVPGEVREYKLISFSGNNALELFANVSSVNRNRHINTISLGKVLSLRNTVGVLDQGNNMHVLYQVRPEYFGYACVSPKGKIVFAKYIKKFESSYPKLVRTAIGGVVVEGGEDFNPKAAAAERKKIHAASERPPGVYQ